MTGTWRSEDNLQELVLSFHAGPKDQTEVGKLGGQHLYPLSHFTSPWCNLISSTNDSVF